MGWGIKIPALGIDTGEFIGGDVAKGLHVAGNVARVMYDPTSWGKFLENNGPREAAANFDDVKSKWSNISDGYNTDANAAAGQLGSFQANAGKQTALNTLGQFGGQGVGADARLERTSRWSQANNMGNMIEENKLNQIQTGMQGIDNEFKIQQGQEMSAAQAEAARKNASGGALGLIGTIGGGIVGGIYGGPAGAAAGASIGGGLGRNLGSR